MVIVDAPRSTPKPLPHIATQAPLLFCPPMFGPLSRSEKKMRGAVCADKPGGQRKRSKRKRNRDEEKNLMKELIEIYLTCQRTGSTIPHPYHPSSPVPAYRESVVRFFRNPRHPRVSAVNSRLISVYQWLAFVFVHDQFCGSPPFRMCTDNLIVARVFPSASARHSISCVPFVSPFGESSRT